MARSTYLAGAHQQQSAIGSPTHDTVAQQEIGDWPRLQEIAVHHQLVWKVILNANDALSSSPVFSASLELFESTSLIAMVIYALHPVCWVLVCQHSRVSWCASFIKSTFGQLQAATTERPAA